MYPFCKTGSVKLYLAVGKLRKKWPIPTESEVKPAVKAGRDLATLVSYLMVPRLPPTPVPPLVGEPIVEVYYIKTQLLWNQGGFLNNHKLRLRYIKNFYDNISITKATKISRTIITDPDLDPDLELRICASGPESVRKVLRIRNTSYRRFEQRKDSSLGRYVFGSEISYNKAPPRLPGLGC